MKSTRQSSGASEDRLVAIRTLEQLVRKKSTAGLVVLALAGSRGFGASASAADAQSSTKRASPAGKTLSVLQRGDVSAQVAGATPVGDGTLRLGGANR